ncbi:hypothetical protein CPB84DRAFT_1827543 [Gymnopilus junonius]|uniref:Uncharacterized protein n=1 Tax=Gymnopilus junonius TaxID=109634 RepID=A0A9P5TI75_GYMJU|nr:hypothetical protein CPB84DRAFT_1827543 [Gymnopilus junonius]
MSIAEGDIALRSTDNQIDLQHQNLLNLVESTKSFLTVVQGWYSTANRDISASKTASIIPEHIGQYVSAFQNGLEAAQSGHDAYEEGLGLVNQLTKAKKDGKTAEDTDVAECIAEMEKFACEGKERAKGALEGFRSVRRGINQRIADIKLETDSDLQSEILGSEVLAKLEPTLEQSIIVLDGYASWWNETDMEESAQTVAVASLAQRFSTLSAKAISSKWKNLRDSYKDYTDKMHELEDAYPSVLKLTPTNDKPQDLEKVQSTRQLITTLHLVEPDDPSHSVPKKGCWDSTLFTRVNQEDGKFVGLLIASYHSARLNSNSKQPPRVFLFTIPFV